MNAVVSKTGRAAGALRQAIKLVCLSASLIVCNQLLAPSHFEKHEQAVVVANKIILLALP